MSPRRFSGGSLGGIFHSIADNAEGLVRSVSHEAEELHKFGDKMMHGLQQDSMEKSTSSRLTRMQSDLRGHQELENIKRSLTDGTFEDQQGHHIVDSVWFHAIVNFLTMMNTLQMGLEADHPDWHRAWMICENVFTAGFTIELVVKLWLLRCKYFDDKANWLDGFLTMIGILDCWILVLVGSGAGWDLQDLSALRILRLLRLARIMRLVRSVKPMVLVIRGVVKAMTHATYVFALCIFIFYVIAIFVTEHLGRSDVETYPGYATETEAIDEQGFMASYNPHVCFGSMLASMLTLFNMAVMSEWAEIVRPIAQKQPWYLPIFLFFATSVGFGVMNVLIGVIVDCVTSESRRIESEYDEEVKKEKLKVLDKIQAVLDEIDHDHDGTIDLEDLAKAWGENALLKDLTDSINLPRGWSAQELLDMLDINGDGLLQHAEFTTSFFRLIECDDDQKNCMFQASINHIKHMIVDQEVHTADKINRIQADVTSIKAALGIESPKRVQTSPELKSYPTESSLGSKSTEPFSNGLHKEDVKSAVSMKDPSGFSKHCCAHGQTYESEIMSPTQLKEALDAAFMSVKEYIHEEFVAIKPCLESELKCAKPKLEFERSGVQNCTSFLEGSPNSERFEFSPIAHCEDSWQLHTLASCSGSPFKVQTGGQTAPSICHGEDCAHPGNGNTALSCHQASFDVHTGQHMSSLSQCEDCDPRGNGNAVADRCAVFDVHTGQTMASNDHCEDGELHGNGNYTVSRCTEAPSDSHKGQTISSHGHCEDCEPAGSSNAAVPRCSEAPFDVHTGQAMSPNGYCEDCGHPGIGNAAMSCGAEGPLDVHTDGQYLGNGSSATSCAEVLVDFHAGTCTDSLHLGFGERHASDAVQNFAFDTQHDTCEFFFDDSTERLGFTVHWVKDRLPMVGEIEFGSAAYVQGVLQGDRLSQCNGVFTDGMERQEVVRILNERPLMLKVLRHV